jgi:hypothetical protein
MQQSAFLVDLFPAKIDQLRDAKTMTIGDQDQRAVAKSVPSDALCRTSEALDFIWRQVFSTSQG